MLFFPCRVQSILRYLVLQMLHGLVLKEKYLVGKEYVLTDQLHQSSLKTPGETRLLNKAVLEEGIIEGVCSGLFGLGELENESPVCRFYREQPSLAFSATEVLIREGLCIEQKKGAESTAEVEYPPYEPGTLTKAGEKEPQWEKPGSQSKSRDKVRIRFEVPKGKVSSIMGVMNMLQSKFDSLEVEIVTTNGEISERDYEDKIMEAFRQLGIEVDEN